MPGNSPPVERAPAAALKAELATPSSEPGGEVGLLVRGCDPAALVTASIGTKVVGQGRSGGDGAASLILGLPEVEVGRYEVLVDCGATATVPLDVVVASAVNTGTQTMGVLIFFVLLLLGLFRRRPPARPGRAKRD